MALLGTVNACARGAHLAPAMQERGWRTYLGSPTRAGDGLESLAVDPQPVWRAELGRGITGGPAITEEVVAIALVDRQVVLLDRATGEVLWRRRLSTNLGAGPLITDDRVLVAGQGNEGKVFALRLSSGKPLWSAPLGDVVAPLAVEESGVYAATTAGWVARLDAGTGARVWRTHVTGAVRTAPVPALGVVVVATAADSLFALSALTGEIVARRATHGTVLAAPAVADSVVIAGTESGRLESLDPRTLAVRWETDLDGPVLGHVAVREGQVWTLAGRGTLWRVPLAGPEGRQHVDTGLVPRAGPAPVPGGVLVCGVNGVLALVDSSGTRRWSARLEAPIIEPPVVDGRTILAVSQRGEVVTFR